MLGYGLCSAGRVVGGDMADVKDWRELCLAVTNEMDSAKLSSLVQELIEALDKGDRSWRPPHAIETHPA